MQEPPRRVVRDEPLDDQSRPATVGDLRSLRRWLLVTAAWAVAATAIALIALVVANRDDDEEDRARTQGQLGRVEQRLDGRIDDLEERVDQLPQSEDVSDLDNRLREVEQRAGRSSNQLDQLSGSLDELETRVAQLEQSDSGTDTTETETAP